MCGKLYRFSYLEHTGKNFDADMKKKAADRETQRCWKETDPCQLPLPDAAAKGKIWADMKEVLQETPVVNVLAMFDPVAEYGIYRK